MGWNESRACQQLWRSREDGPSNQLGDGSGCVPYLYNFYSGIGHCLLELSGIWLTEFRWGPDQNFHMPKVTCSIKINSKSSQRVHSFEMIWIRIHDPRSLGSLSIKWTDESTLDKDLSVHLIYHDPSDLGSLILIQIISKECTQINKLITVVSCLIFWTLILESWSQQVCWDEICYFK